MRFPLLFYINNWAKENWNLINFTLNKTRIFSDVRKLILKTNVYERSKALIISNIYDNSIEKLQTISNKSFGTYFYYESNFSTQIKRFIFLLLTQILSLFSRFGVLFFKVVVKSLLEIVFEFWRSVWKIAQDIER